MKLRFAIVFLLLSSLILFNQFAWGSVGSIINAGTFNKGVAGDTGARELIELKEKGELLVGWTKHETIRLVTVYAPGSKGDHIILRDITFPDGKTSILLSAPDSFMKKVRRATIYVKHKSRDLMLYNLSGEKWQERKPISVTLNMTDGNEKNEDYLLAFTIDRLGLYWMLEGNAINVVTSPVLLDYPSASMLFGGSISRGLLPWTWAIAFFIIGATISFLAYLKDRNRG